MVAWERLPDTDTDLDPGTDEVELEPLGVRRRGVAPPALRRSTAFPAHDASGVLPVVFVAVVAAVRVGWGLALREGLTPTLAGLSLLLVLVAGLGFAELEFHLRRSP